MGLYQGRYRVESERLKGWDYTSPGWYFVTLCTEGRVPSFGKIRNGLFLLSPVGRIAADEWLRTPFVRSSVTLDEWTVMPDHIHGIIVINRCRGTLCPVETGFSPAGLLRNGRGMNDGEVTRRVASPEISTGADSRGVPTHRRRMTLQANSLGSIIGQFKSVCTKKIAEIGFRSFSWQSGFYDHIIRDRNELYRIRNYIRQNLRRWNESKN